MERGSDKHSPRIDEQMQHELEPLLEGAPGTARAREDLEPEILLPEEGNLNAARPDLPSAGELTPDALDLRAELAAKLAGARFPADRDALIAEAQDAEADEDIMQRLRSLPEAGPYENVQAVWQALGGPTEAHHTS